MAASTTDTEPSAVAIERLQANIESALLGKPEVVRLAVTGLLAQGHLLIEDVPGVGKTSLAKAIAQSLDCEFTRLQCTPDMLPSDIIGSSIFRPSTGEFEFRKGPVFTNVLLTDEINRTTPRTQSALLEAMNEHQVSVEGVTYPLSLPFLVVATQNPFEFEGTYPLPENQLDRFMLRLEIGYPERSIEKDVLTAHRNGEPVGQLGPVMTAEELRSLQQDVRTIRVEDAIADYLLAVVEATRDHDELTLGVSTRGALTLYRAVQAAAMVAGRDYAIPDDVQELAVSVFAHRVHCRGLIREGHRERAVGIIEQILDTVPVPQ